MSDDGIVSKGTTIAGATTTPIGQVTNITMGGGSVSIIDTSTLASTSRTKLAGISEAGTIEVEARYTQAGADKILDNVAQANEVFTVTFSDSSTWVCTGFISSTPQITAAMDDAVNMSFSITLTGVAVCAAGGA